MIRSRLACIKHIFLTILILASLACALEVGLHIYGTCVEAPVAETKPTDPLIVKSWLTYHALKPQQTITKQLTDTSSSVQVSTNTYGLRGAEPAIPKPPDVYRIICLGDDSTFAPDIEASQTFCSLLQSYLQSQTRYKVEVINAGVPGYCPLLSYLQVKHSLLGLQPDLLVLNFDMSDIADDHKYRKHTIIAPGSEPLSCPHPDLLKPKKSTLIKRITDNFHTARWCKQQLEQFSPTPAISDDLIDIDTPEGKYAWLENDPPNWSIHIQQALSPLQQLHVLTERSYVELVVSTFPSPWQASPSASHGARAEFGIPEGAIYRNRLPFSTLGTYLQQHQIAFCDTSPIFQNSPHAERLYLSHSAQFSDEGHQLYASELAKFVRYRVASHIWNDGSPPPNRQPPSFNQAMPLDPFPRTTRR